MKLYLFVFDLREGISDAVFFHNAFGKTIGEAFNKVVESELRTQIGNEKRSELETREWLMNYLDMVQVYDMNRSKLELYAPDQYDTYGKTNYSGSYKSAAELLKQQI